MLNCTKPLVIVNNLKGIGVKPATASRVAHAIIPPSDVILFLRKKLSSTP